MLVLGVTIGLGVLFAWRGKQGNRGDGVTRLAVLPFENLGDSADAYFAEGMTDEVRGKLSGLPKLQVTARQSTTEYRGSKKPLRQIGEELGVRYLLTATVRWEKTGNMSRVRVTPELVDVSTSATRWQQPFDANLTDVFQVQGDIAAQVAQALDVELTTGEQQQLAEKPTTNLAAYDAFLRGEAESQEMSVNDPPSLRRALPYYERAIALDSSFALAWSRAARVHASLYANSVPVKAEAEAARVAAERAVALAPARGHGHLALANYYRLVLSDPCQSGGRVY
jgi:TolB-like protein